MEGVINKAFTCAGHET